MGTEVIIVGKRSISVSIRQWPYASAGAEDNGE
jgi:hypothetical protein